MLCRDVMEPRADAGFETERVAEGALFLRVAESLRTLGLDAGESRTISSL